MDIKPVNTGNVNLNPADEAAPVKKPGKTDAPPTGAAGPADPATAGPLDKVRPSVSRADLMSDRKDPLVRQTIHTLLDSAAAEMGPLPDGAREKITDMLAEDPLFTSRVVNYWNNNLS